MGPKIFCACLLFTVASAFNINGVFNLERDDFKIKVQLISSSRLVRLYVNCKGKQYTDDFTLKMYNTSTVNDRAKYFPSRLTVFPGDRMLVEEYVEVAKSNGKSLFWSKYTELWTFVREYCGVVMASDELMAFVLLEATPNCRDCSHNRKVIAVEFAGRVFCMATREVGRAVDFPKICL